MHKTTGLSVGWILTDPDTKTQYRLIAIPGESAVLCVMGTSRFILREVPRISVYEMLDAGSLVAGEDEPYYVDTDTLSPAVRDDFMKKRAMMREVVEAYRPDFLRLCGKRPKPEAVEIAAKYGLTSPVFWRLVRQFFQGGMRDCCLLDARAMGPNKGRRYKFTEKPGRRSETMPDQGIPIGDVEREHFEDALQYYKSNPELSYRDAFDYMNRKYYLHKFILNGAEVEDLLPENERPAEGQFRHFMRSNLSREEIIKIKTSDREYRNDARPLLGDTVRNARGPGDIVVIDAWEGDVYLVSLFDNNKTIGKPIVYAMVDDYSHAVIAVSVTLDNNSVRGLTNLFMNLGDDKHEYCARFGIGFPNDDMWPSNILPNLVRVDRGSDMKSMAFGEVCERLDIQKEILPGATGSMKGNAERFFRQIKDLTAAHLKGKGLVDGRYETDYRREATLNLFDYTQIVITALFYHNQECLESYPSTRDMITKGIKAKPSHLWNYGVEKFGAPRPIPDPGQYRFDLMEAVSARIGRRGITYDGLYYIPVGDPVAQKAILGAGSKVEKFPVRKDPRCVDHLYYVRDGRMYRADLNTGRADCADAGGLTFSQWDELKKIKKQMDKKGKVDNEKLRAYTHGMIEFIVDAAAGLKVRYSDAKDMRPARELEKEAVAASLALDLPVPGIPDKEAERAESPHEEADEAWDGRILSIEEAFDAFDDED